MIMRKSYNIWFFLVESVATHTMYKSDSDFRSFIEILKLRNTTLTRIIVVYQILQEYDKYLNVYLQQSFLFIMMDRKTC